ncbi:YrzI family small protein [Bacillus cytotoxicus]|nr:YrzI family small protein [Bacillus cereus group sp. BfR-BA-01492]EMA6342878.1 YrzI family small protein [Bacillus cytotoxicus]
MTFRVLFLSITIQKTTTSEADLAHNEQIEKAMNEIKERQTLYCDHL